MGMSESCVQVTEQAGWRCTSSPRGSGRVSTFLLSLWGSPSSVRNTAHSLCITSSELRMVRMQAHAYMYI